MECSLSSTSTVWRAFTPSKSVRTALTQSQSIQLESGLHWLRRRTGNSSSGSGSQNLVCSSFITALDVLKQQGHFFDLNCLAYSPDGSLIATGGDDGKVKLWTTKNSLSFVTFKEHTAQVTDIKFSPKKGNAVLSCSLDGTVRAYDLVKYRNFRVMTAEKGTQFTCLAVDSSGEIICAGSLDPYRVFVWNLRTGHLLESLDGHTAPISSLAFASEGVRIN